MWKKVEKKREEWETASHQGRSVCDKPGGLVQCLGLSIYHSRSTAELITLFPGQFDWLLTIKLTSLRLNLKFFLKIELVKGYWILELFIFSKFTVISYNC